MIVRFLARFFAWFSTPALLRIGRAIGRIWFYVIPIRRGVAVRAVARAFPEKSAAEVRRIVRGNFEHLGCSLVESLAYLSWPEERLQKLLRYEGIEESVDAPRNAGHGVVAVSAHIGNFEICTDGFGVLQNTPMMIVARLPKAGFARSMIEAFRARNPLMEVFEPKGSAPRVVDALRTKRSVLAFVIDQNVRRGRGIFIPFLGEIANTTTGFASLQRRAESGLCVVHMYREPDGSHRVRVKPVPPSTHPNERVAILNDTLTMSNYIQSFVRERPEQWFWVHRRWKARPEPGDLMRTDAGLERFARGRVAAFFSPSLASDSGHAEASRRLRDAGVGVFDAAGAVERARLATEEGLDLASALVVEEGGDLVAVADRFLEQTVASGPALR